MMMVTRRAFLRNLLNRRALVCVVCVLSIVMLLDTYSHTQRFQWNAFLKFSAIFTTAEQPSAYASFLIIRLNLSATSTSKHATFPLAEIAAKIKVPPCDRVRSFQFYVLKYVENQAVDTTRLVLHLNQSFDRCAHPVRTTISELVMPDSSLDWRFVRDRILDAYLDDADFFHILTLSEDSARLGNVDFQAMKDVLLRRSSHGVGVVVDNSPRADAIPGVFFSKIHLEIFGGAYPVTAGSLARGLGYVVSLYESSHFATFRYEKKKKNSKEDMTSKEGSKDQEKLAAEKAEDLAVLKRYLSAVETTEGPWRSVGSGRRVIAMSLYGDGRRYTIGALRNAQLLPVVFPGWRLWFYCEKPPPDEGGGKGGGGEKYGRVPKKILRKLVELGAEIKYVDVVETGLAPMLWRFTVAEDVEVDAFTVRDSDSRLTPRDAAVVADWLRKNASFHCVRDHPSHSLFSVSGGLWGGRPKELSALFNGTLRSFMKGYGPGYVADMHFLGQKVWPLVQHVAFCHDSFSCQKFPASHPFPVERIGYEHLGQVYDENSVGRQGDINILAGARVNENCVPKKVI